MKHIFTAIATFALLLLFSCSKEKSIDSTDPDSPGQNGNQNTGSLLVRGVLTDGTDSIATNYSYDSKGRLTGQSVSATLANFINVEFDIERHGDGQINQYNFSSSEFITLGIGSVDYKLKYDAGKSQYENKVMQFELQNLTIKDSTVYEYNAQNRIVKTERFLRNPLTLEYIKTTIQEFTYNNSGDLVKSLIFYFDEDQNDFVLFDDSTYEYDDKTNPLQLGNEAIVLEVHNLYSSHNVKRETVIYPDDPDNNRNVSVDFTYNTENKPVNATLTDNLNGGTSTFKYYYN